MKLSRDIYVVISERASESGHDYPIVWETRANDATYEEARAMQIGIGPDYGKTCIAHLRIIEESRSE